MEGLFVDGIDRHLRRAKQTRIVKRADLQDNQWQTRSSRCEMGPAFAAKFARHGAFEIGTREFARFAARVTKALRLHEHEHVRRAAADILAFAAMALRLEARFALCHVANFTAIASAFEFHGRSLRKQNYGIVPPRRQPTLRSLKLDAKPDWPQSGMAGGSCPRLTSE